MFGWRFPVGQGGRGPAEDKIFLFHAQRAERDFELQGDEPDGGDDVRDAVSLQRVREGNHTVRDSGSDLWQRQIRRDAERGGLEANDGGGGSQVPPVRKNGTGIKDTAVKKQE